MERIVSAASHSVPFAAAPVSAKPSVTATPWLDLADIRTLEANGVETRGVTLKDTWAHIKTLSSSEIEGFTALDVTGIDVTDADAAFSLPQAQAIADLGGTVAVTVPTKHIAEISLAAKDTFSLTGKEIDQLAVDGVKTLASAATTLSLTAGVAAELGADGFSLALPSKGTAEIVDAAADIAGLSPTQLTDIQSLGVHVLDLTDPTATLFADQSTALSQAQLLFDVTGTQTVTETFAGSPTVKILASGLAIDSTGSNTPLNVDVSASGITVSETGDSLGFLRHASETLDATKDAGATFTFGAGFGKDTLEGFAKGDTISFAASEFGKTSSTSQSADFTALLNHTTFSGGAAHIAVGANTLIIDGIANKAALNADTAQFKFT